MNRLPRLTGQEVARALSRSGFEVVRQRGSHLFLKHVDGRSMVVPIHNGEVLDRASCPRYSGMPSLLGRSFANCWSREAVNAHWFICIRTKFYLIILLSSYLRFCLRGLQLDIT
jgi:predicted RNA binding protein YcfA (HicA-like mRNA interferase family)